MYHGSIHRRVTVFDALSFGGASRLGRVLGALLSIILLQPLVSMAAQEDPDPAVEFVLQAPFPLGTEAFLLMPGKRNFYLFGSLENHDFDGIHVIRVHHKGSITRFGERVRYFPEQVVFRVTATTSAPDVALDPPSQLDYSQDVNQLLLGLRFQLRIFRGLEGVDVEPYDVRMIGIPSDQPSDERIYRVSFRTEGVPVDARLALDVCTPAGERIARFRIELL
jgi:hypothetical protein